MASEDLAYAPATELLGLITTRQVSPVELTEFYYKRIDRLDPQLNAYLMQTQDSAMEAAREAETTVVRGDELGPLHGLPISIKDTQNTRGVRTTMGSLLFEDRVPEPCTECWTSMRIEALALARDGISAMEIAGRILVGESIVRGWLRAVQ